MDSKTRDLNVRAGWERISDARLITDAGNNKFFKLTIAQVRSAAGRGEIEKLLLLFPRVKKKFRQMIFDM